MKYMMTERSRDFSKLRLPFRLFGQWMNCIAPSARLLGFHPVRPSTRTRRAHTKWQGSIQQFSVMIKLNRMCYIVSRRRRRSSGDKIFWTKLLVPILKPEATTYFKLDLTGIKNQNSQDLQFETRDVSDPSKQKTVSFFNYLPLLNIWFSPQVK